MKPRDLEPGHIITARGRLQDRDEPCVDELEQARVEMNVTGADYLPADEIGDNVDVLYVRLDSGSHTHWAFRSDADVELVEQHQAQAS